MSSDRPTQYTSTDKKRQITLDMSQGTSALLAEVTRAFLHTGNPSVAVKTFLKGVRYFRAEEGQNATTEDITLLTELEEGLILLFNKTLKREDELYGDGSSPLTQSSTNPPLARPETPVGGFHPQPAPYQKATVRDVPRPKVCV